MLYTTVTTTIKTISVEETDETLIARGIAEFHYWGKDGVVSDEIAYRCKGVPAVIINSVGVETTGTVEGYIDFALVSRGSLKEKIATLVIRNFVKSAEVSQETPESVVEPVTLEKRKATRRKSKSNKKELAAIV